MASALRLKSHWQTDRPSRLERGEGRAWEDLVVHPRGITQTRPAGRHQAWKRVKVEVIYDYRS